MKHGSAAATSGKRWGGAGLLRLLFVGQCALGVLVVTADLPANFLQQLITSEPRAPDLEVPVAPGNQTRRFEPSRVPMDLPSGPGFPVDEAVPSRLEFTTTGSLGQVDTVLITGAIMDGDAARFAAWLEAAPNPPSAIALHSPGGDVVEALQIGRVIRENDLPVRVESGAFCFSACPYILAAGSARVVSKQAYVGVHQHYFGENTYLPAFLLVSDIQAGQGEVMNYLEEMGVDPMIMAKALVTPPEDIYILLPDEMEAFNLATTLID
jgi:hypothetical protein